MVGLFSVYEQLPKLPNLGMKLAHCEKDPEVPHTPSFKPMIRIEKKTDGIKTAET